VSLTHKILVNGVPRKEFAPMSQEKNKDQIIARISMENGIPKVMPLSAEEQRQFIKTHPNLQLPTFSLADIQQATTILENMIPNTADPSAR
jgi:hypothetical protein